jgi:hypothetical protein
MLAILVYYTLESVEFLAKAIGLAKRLLVVVGDGEQERSNLDFVKTPKSCPEALLSQVEGANVHRNSSRKSLNYI